MTDSLRIDPEIYRPYRLTYGNRESDVARFDSDKTAIAHALGTELNTPAFTIVRVDRLMDDVTIFGE